VAGDFYDYIERPDGRWLMTVGDVAGKGVPASLVMVMAQTAIRSVACEVASPAALLAQLNAQLLRDHGGQGTVTLFAAVLSPGDGLLRFASAGHEFPLVVTPAGQCLELGVGGPFLGIFPEVTYSEGWVLIPEDHQLIMFTDGVYDLPAPGGRIATTETLATLARPGSGALDEVFDAIGQPQSDGGGDDVTLILADRRVSTPCAAPGDQSGSPRPCGGLTVACDMSNSIEAQRFVGDLVRWRGEGSLSARVGRAAGQIVERLSPDDLGPPGIVGAVSTRLTFSVTLEARAVRVHLQIDSGPPVDSGRLEGLAPRLTADADGFVFEWPRD
jgi:hypothetical protein